LTQNTADQGLVNFSEDCLTLNVVRPAGSSSDEKLPVGVFIHGGGWTMDFAANGAYNMSFMVEEAVKAGKPFVAVSVACK
jgi:carboxylesterase type B